MFLKKIESPRSITLPDGSVMSRADLPPADTRRWVASRKMKVVLAVRHGLLPLSEALERYALSSEEFDEWCRAVDREGEKGLKVTRRGR